MQLPSGLQLEAITPDSIGTTFGFDSVVGLSEQAALLLRSMTVFRASMNVIVELYRAATVADLDWLALAKTVRPMAEAEHGGPAVRVVDATGDEMALDLLESQSHGTRIRVGYWGPLDSTRNLVALRLEWQGLAGGSALPASAIRSARDNAVDIWPVDQAKSFVDRP